MSQNQIKPTHELLHFIKQNQEIIQRSNALTFLSFQNQEIVQRSNALMIPTFQTWEDRFKVQRLNDHLLSKNQEIVSRSNALKRLLFATKINQKDKNNLTNVQFLKNYISLISSSQLRNT